MPLDDAKLARLHARYPRRRATITGAGSGLGRALALSLAPHGWQLFLNDVSEARLTATARQCIAAGAAIATSVFDVADLPAFEAFAAETLKAAGGWIWS